MENKGLHELLKSYQEVHPQPPLTTETIYSFLLDIFKDYQPTEDLSWKHYTWEQDGNLYSMWCSGGICMGDKGKENFDRHYSKLLKETSHAALHSTSSYTAKQDSTNTN